MRHLREWIGRTAIPEQHGSIYDLWTRSARHPPPPAPCFGKGPKKAAKRLDDVPLQGGSTFFVGSADLSKGSISYI